MIFRILRITPVACESWLAFATPDPKNPVNYVNLVNPVQNGAARLLEKPQTNPSPPFSCSSLSNKLETVEIAIRDRTHASCRACMQSWHLLLFAFEGRVF